MTGTGSSPQPRASIGQIADLLAWARSLAQRPYDVDPHERAAFQQAKIDLLARISDNTDHTPGGRA